MKKVAAVALAMSLTGGAALGGIVEFSPSKADVLPGEEAIFDVTLVSETLGDMDAADVVFGSDNVPFTFAYSDEWMAAMSNVSPIDTPPSPPFPTFVNFVGGNNPDPIGQSSILLGTIRADTTGLAEGQYEVFVHSAVLPSVLVLEGTTEPLSGTGLINVVPEPATLALLGVGAVALIRRRQTA